MRQSRDQAWLKFSIIEGLPWILRSFSLDFPAQRSPQLPKNQESGMHIPCDSMILPRLRNPQVWGISDPSKIHLEQLEPGVFPVYFWISAPGVHLDAPPSCFSKGKNRKKKNLRFSPSHHGHHEVLGEKKESQTLPGVVSISSPISPRFNPKASLRGPKKLRSPGVPLSFIHCGSLNSRGLGSRLPGIKTFPLLWLP